MAFPIVAIRASAGGFGAVRALPSRSHMACVVVQSLDPGHESLLSELLGRKTAMPVKQIHYGMTIEANHVYVIPPNKPEPWRRNRRRIPNWHTWKPGADPSRVPCWTP